jgi:hypothetical protein
MKKSSIITTFMLVGAILTTIPRYTAATTGEVLGVLACGYSIHTFAREDKTWLGSVVSLGKSAVLLGTGLALLGTNQGLELLTGNLSALITTITTYAQNKYNERVDEKETTLDFTP